MQQQEESAPRDLATVEQFSKRYPAWSPAALRSLILNSRDRLSSRGERVSGNGLEEAGAIIRLGRRVLISEGRFFAWVLPKRLQAILGH
jgi:hypothetical protein